MTPVREIMVDKVLNTAAMIVPAVVLSVVLGALIGPWRVGGAARAAKAPS